MSVQYQIQMPGFLFHLIVMAISGVVTYYWGIIVFFEDESYPIFSAIGALAPLLLIFYPVALVGDVSDYIPKIAEYNKNAKENGKEKIKVNHPNTAIVWILFIIGFFTFGIFWIFALIMATGTRIVTIPDDVMDEIGEKKVEVNVQELLALKKLLDEEVLTQEQFDEQKSKIGF